MILRDSPELVWRTAGLTAFAITAVGSLTPTTAPPASADALVHLFVYALIAALLARGAWTRIGGFIWAIAAVIGGVVIEVLQGFVGRDPSLADALSNLAGGMLGALLGARHAASRPSSRRRRSGSASAASFQQGEQETANN